MSFLIMADIWSIWPAW